MGVHSRTRQGCFCCQSRQSPSRVSPSSAEDEAIAVLAAVDEAVAEGVCADGGARTGLVGADLRDRGGRDEHGRRKRKGKLADHGGSLQDETGVLLLSVTASAIEGFP